MFYAKIKQSRNFLVKWLTFSICESKLNLGNFLTTFIHVRSAYLAFSKSCKLTRYRIKNKLKTGFLSGLYYQTGKFSQTDSSNVYQVHPSTVFWQRTFWRVLTTLQSVNQFLVRTFGRFCELTETVCFLFSEFLRFSLACDLWWIRTGIWKSKLINVFTVYLTRTLNLRTSLIL